MEPVRTDSIVGNRNRRWIKWIVICFGVLILLKVGVAIYVIASVKSYTPRIAPHHQVAN
jgi:hypothetical protein